MSIVQPYIKGTVKWKRKSDEGGSVVIICIGYGIFVFLFESNHAHLNTKCKHVVTLEGKKENQETKYCLIRKT